MPKFPPPLLFYVTLDILVLLLPMPITIKAPPPLRHHHHKCCVSMLSGVLLGSLFSFFYHTLTLIYTQKTMIHIHIQKLRGWPTAVSVQ